MIEQIEPRILYSADLNPAIAANPATLPQFEQRVVGASGEFTHFSDASVEVSRQEVVFVDTATPDYQQLVDDIGNNKDSDSNFDVVLLDGDRDGIAQISDYLARAPGCERNSYHLARQRRSIPARPGHARCRVGQTKRQSDFPVGQLADFGCRSDDLRLRCGPE